MVHLQAQSASRVSEDSRDKFGEITRRKSAVTCLSERNLDSRWLLTHDSKTELLAFQNLVFLEASESTISMLQDQ